MKSLIKNHLHPLSLAFTSGPISYFMLLLVPAVTSNTLTSYLLQSMPVPANITIASSKLLILLSLVFRNENHYFQFYSGEKLVEELPGISHAQKPKVYRGDTKGSTDSICLCQFASACILCKCFQLAMGDRERDIAMICSVLAAIP
ncbi:hypothetical protein RRG08_048977 [Elysia crispata]|uniref:Uncharacterized protein n=1 Tax=Elysia crispata TaxID=231223 RepID=A0AAE1CW53_9GAST|nr:hypothetical protein RRG08_048977 [Elysia crispata]